MTILPVAARLARVVDGAVLWRLGVIGVAGDQPVTAGAADPAAFWAKAALDPDADLEERTLTRHRIDPRGGRPVLLELTGASRGPGDHQGATRLRAVAALHPDPTAPVVVVLHGYAVPTSWYEDRTMAQLLRRGLSAVRLELPFHLSRRVPGHRPGAGFFSSDLEHTSGVLRQAVEDVASVVGWARRRGASAVGLHGVSLGALVAALLAANRPVDSAMLVTPPCELGRVILETAPIAVRRRLGVVDGRGGPWGEDAEVARDVLGELLAPLTPRRLALRTDPARVVLVVADHDHVVGPGPVRELAATWGTDLWSYGHGHVTVMAARGLVGRLQQRLVDDLGGRRTTATAG